MRPNSTIGATTTGMPTITSSVSLTLVASIMAMPPIISRKLRTAIDALLPMTCSSIVVSLVSRDITSPVRAASKKLGGSDIR